MTVHQSPPCPLCESLKTSLRTEDKVRAYYLCATCELLFVESSHFLSNKDEKAEYDLHENSPDDPGYRTFLSQMFHPMQQRLQPSSTGLDFGSGPGPTLHLMFEEVGHTMFLYDPFYANHPECLAQSYDFVTATEVVEHFHQPKRDLEKIWSCVRPGGWLGIMTQLWSEQSTLSSWRYMDDPTHVSFFSQHTFQWLARQWGATHHRISRNVQLFEKCSQP